jgi:hypothetical protein
MHRKYNGVVSGESRKNHRRGHYHLLGQFSFQKTIHRALIAYKII